MTRTLAHRGPDDEGYFDGPRAWLGHRRLSIIDLSTGHQPLFSADGSVVVVFNGEIYNYLELRAELLALGHTFLTQSDTEVLTAAYRQWGVSMLARLNGMFAFALWEPATQKLLLARDRMGKKPLYLAKWHQGLAFASELKALLCHPGVKRDIDLASLQRYLLCDAVPAPGSILQGVGKLPAGGYLQWEAGRVVHEGTYWDLSFPEPLQISPRELEQETWRRLRQAVGLRLRSDVPLGVFLSGGIDSSAVLAAMSELVDPSTISTFSIGFRDPSFDESSHARKVAAHFGTQHHEKTLEPSDLTQDLPQILGALDEPLADPSLLPTLALCKFARQQVKVALSGDGGDELWLGYPTFGAQRLSAALGHLPTALLRALPLAANALPVSTKNWSADYRAKRFAAGLQYPNLLQHFVWIGSFAPAAQRALFAADLRAELASPFDFIEAHRERGRFRSDYDALAYLYAKVYLGDCVLVKVDRASMAHALEVRSPLLDVNFVEFVAQLPTHLKLHRGTSKVLLRRALQAKLPPEILARPKKGFGIPIAEWFKGPLREFIHDLLSPSRIQRDGLFDAGAVAGLLRGHMEGTADYRKELWSLAMFHLWIDHWLAGESLRA
jgi:asparagine synthase (glutamine-hydrolysing)